jgi:hypothetical protein
LPAVRCLGLPLLLAAALALSACGKDNTLSVGDCTDADPTLATTAVEPSKVGCDSSKAKSKITREVDKKEQCTGDFVLHQGSSYFCLAPHGKTFGSELKKASSVGSKRAKDAIDNLGKGISTSTTPQASP